VAKQKYDRKIIENAIEKSLNEKKEIAQLTIKIDSKLDNALAILSEKINISKNKLIENILFESGIIEEVEENYYD
jgi:predicted HicB family RNase H-like nuclease